jgi:branched-subunit amino acid aminotransferase/4-amino-4-deoxychorismate lyase
MQQNQVQPQQQQLQQPPPPKTKPVKTRRTANDYTVEEIVKKFPKYKTSHDALKGVARKTMKKKRRVTKPPTAYQTQARQIFANKQKQAAQLYRTKKDQGMSYQDCQKMIWNKN